MTNHRLATLQKSIVPWLPGPVRRELVRNKPIGVQEFTVELFGGEQLKLDQCEKSTLLRKLFWLGIDGHEPWSIRTFYMLSQTSDCILDVGAFFGLYGLAAALANPKADIHCFEPFPDNNALMQHYVALNNLANIKTHDCALSDTKGTVGFHVPVKKSTKLPDIGSLTNRFEDGHHSNKQTREIQVEVTTIDEFCDAQQIQSVDLIKIDAEEAELQVLQGAQRTIEKCQPDLLCEIIFDNPQLPAIESLLKDHGYCFYGMLESGITQTPTLLEPLAADTDTRLQKNHGGYTEMLLTKKTPQEINQLVANMNWKPVARQSAA